MALHFHGHQFNQAYDPRRLSNWEVPRNFPLQFPHKRVGRTQIIANNSGHLLPGVPRPKGVGTGPWGHFIPTWQMPRKISRSIAEELRNPRPKDPAILKLLGKEQDEQKQEQPKLVEKPKEEIKQETSAEGIDPCADKPNKTQEADDCTPAPSWEVRTVVHLNTVRTADLDDEPVQEKDLSYVPGDLTEPKHRHESYSLLRPKTTTSLESLQTKMSTNTKHHRRGQSPKQNPFACVYRNFEMAKRCAKENLEHHPLPDTVTDAMFRKLQMERAQHPGLALEDEVKCTGIGWKGYGASGPTQCTKLRVYRPKTCAQKKHKDEPMRPGSCGSFDMKWRFIKQQEVTPIELAICWDMTPVNPNDEPKRTTHIDGSNGSAAPAVFQMVHSPKQPDILTPTPRKSSAKCDGIHGCNTEKSNSVSSSRSGCKSAQNNLDKHSISTNSLYVNIPHTRKLSADSFGSSQKLSRKELHKSSPNLSMNCSECSCWNKQLKRIRPCEACDKKQENNPNAKDDYKFAFKAGKPQEIKSIDGSSSGSNKSYVKVPKQKDPYAKRNYDINSLHPPFSIWKGSSCPSYPEHWRLASIYQHSYKPVENRKKPLLASVFQ